MKDYPMKNIVITGATDGIGRETARQLLRHGCRVLVHGRTPDKAERTVSALLEECPDGEAEAVHADLSEMQQVLALAQQVRTRMPVLDVLINNAGVYEQARRITPDGFETTLAVNHFAPFLLTSALEDLISAAPRGRVVTVSSIAHQMGRLDLDDLNFSKAYSSYGAYAASKLANILFTVALAKRLEGTSATANCLHPGVIDTKLLRKGFGPGGARVETGARTSVYLALSEQVSDVNGAYFEDCRKVFPSRTARDAALAEALWRRTAELLRPFLVSSGQ
jgi:retinol dehydrogenase-12